MNTNKSTIKYFIIDIFLIFCLLIISTNTYAKENKTEFTTEIQEYNSVQNEIIPYSIQYTDLRQNKAKLSTGLLFGVSKYDLRDNIEVDVKKQSENGCWASSGASIYETHMALKYGLNNKISTRHMDYATSQSFLYGQENPLGFNREVDTSGSMFVSLAYFINGSGPILEKDMPFSKEFGNIDIDEIKNKQVIRKLDDYIMFPSIYKLKTGNEILYRSEQKSNEKIYTETQVQEIRNTIKTHIMTNGAVGCGIVGSKNNLFLNSNTYAFYCDDITQQLDHQVTIIGWDDNYAINNFKEGKQPTKPGAYIALNSWGQNFGNNGIFYISYEDAFVESFILGIENSSEVNYDNIYQYDPLGMSASTQLIDVNTNNYKYPEIFGANIFTRNIKEDEYLTEVGISTIKNLKCEIYVNPNNGNLLSSNFIKVETNSNTTMEPGYHTLKLKQPIKLTGDEFSIAVKYIETTENEGAFTTLERPMLNSYWENAESSRGESYIGISLNEMQDLIDLGFQNTNVCIKGFTSINKEEIKNKKINVKTIAFNGQKHYNDIISEFIVELDTENIENGSILNIEIMQDNLILTDNFNIIGNTINDNKAKINVEIKDLVESGTYTLKIVYDDIIITRELIYEKQVIDTPIDIVIESDEYSIDNEKQIIGKVTANTTVQEFKSKIKVIGEVKIYNLNSEELYDKALVGTSMILKINGEKTYRIIVRGDLNGDGKITTTDLSKLKAYMVSLLIFNDDYIEKAADINYDNGITITDLSILKRIMIGII